ncbi:MAG: 50S ribosomal protein L4 [Candidatus Hermodarchaeota archaeon]|nr:50S ribosomal protein L4 [Candidatus Hermodarchaeota archaeon]
MPLVKLLTLEGKKKGTISLPPIFDTALRRDVIKRAVLAKQSAGYQRHGVDPLAGKRTTAASWGVGHGRARVPRRKGQGYRSASHGAFAPFTVSGRRTHPPEARKNPLEQINKKERRLAIRSAVAATANSALVTARGHRFEVEELPIVTVDDLQAIESTQEAKDALTKLGLWVDIIRVKNGRKIRGGNARRRGRKYRKPVGPLIVIAEDKGIRKAARNIPGVTVRYVSKLNAEDLAPGTEPGRLTVWTKSAIDALTAGLFGGGQ